MTPKRNARSAAPIRNAPREGTRSKAPRKARPATRILYDEHNLPPLQRPPRAEIEKLLMNKSNIPTLVESSYLSRAFGSSNYLFKSQEQLDCFKCNGPNQVEEDYIKKGNEICAPHEEELSRLESIIRPYAWFNKLPPTQPARGDYVSKIDQALSEYRHLVMDIVVKSASQSTTFKMQDSTPSRVAKDFWVSPLNSHVESKTVVSEQDGMPALLCLIDNEPFAPFKNIKDKPTQILDTLAFEMSAQMLDRSAKGCLTYQGLTFDGDIVSLLFMRVEKPSDIFKEHQTAVGFAMFPLVDSRPVFIAAMTELLCGHRDYRNIFQYSKQFQKYNVRKGKFNDIEESNVFVTIPPGLCRG